jgi:hypothetical protein
VTGSLKFKLLKLIKNISHNEPGTFAELEEQQGKEERKNKGIRTGK